VNSGAEGRGLSEEEQALAALRAENPTWDESEIPPGLSGRVLSRECRGCGAPLTDADALTCSPVCGEKWRATVLAMPAGCERSGECALPFRHAGDCDWGA
jgi:hypothetical protein